MDFTGIENEAEFFPAGTLSEVLRDELRDATSRWSDQTSDDNPVERLQRAAGGCREHLNRLRNTKNKTTRKELLAEVHRRLFAALGYNLRREAVLSGLDTGDFLPAIGKVADADGRDAIWLFEALPGDRFDESEDPLGVSFLAEQFPEGEQNQEISNDPIEEILGDGVFGLKNGPRCVLLFGISQVVLVDRHKWPARSVLRFDLQEIFSRQDKDTLTLMACLLAREARVPEQGIPLADRLEEEAQRNANAVTASLKKTIRDAIEILGQEVLDVTDGRYPSGLRKGRWIDGKELSMECLRYMYRLMFLFYAEANPRLKVLNLDDSVYASGYSVEALRDLESVRLRTAEERDGTYLWQSLQRTLELLFTGKGGAMCLPAVKVALLDPASTPILNSVLLRNEAVQKIIRLFSLRTSGRGTLRISYAKLGIGQLGAVYETLISFTGFVAKQDLIEIRPASKAKSAQITTEETEDESEEFDNMDENGLSGGGGVKQIASTRLPQAISFLGTAWRSSTGTE